MNNTEKCFLVHIRLGGKPATARIREAVSQIKGIVSDLSPDYHLAYSSEDGGTFGLFIKSSLTADRIKSRINSPGKEGEGIIPCSFRSDDKMLILEIGEESSDLCNATALSWLRGHHRKKTKDQPPHTTVADASEAQGQLANQLAEIKDKLAK